MLIIGSCVLFSVGFVRGGMREGVRPRGGGGGGGRGPYVYTHLPQAHESAFHTALSVSFPMTTLR